MRLETQEVLEKARFFLKIPFTFTVVTVGFVIEFMIHAPFVILCELDQQFRRKR
jgi:uncharacterized membrane protein